MEPKLPCFHISKEGNEHKIQYSKCKIDPFIHIWCWSWSLLYFILLFLHGPNCVNEEWKEVKHKWSELEVNDVSLDFRPLKQDDVLNDVVSKNIHIVSFRKFIEEALSFSISEDPIKFNSFDLNSFHVLVVDLLLFILFFIFTLTLSKLIDSA